MFNLGIARSCQIIVDFIYKHIYTAGICLAGAHKRRNIPVITTSHLITFTKPSVMSRGSNIKQVPYGKWDLPVAVNANTTELPEVLNVKSPVLQRQQRHSVGTTYQTNPFVCLGISTYQKRSFGQTWWRVRCKAWHPSPGMDRTMKQRHANSVDFSYRDIHSY